MDNQSTNPDAKATTQHAKCWRAKTLGQLWRRLIDTLSPRLPKVFPAEF